MQARWIAGLSLAFGVFAASLANAATIGGLTANSLEAWNQAGGVGAPTVLTCDDFSLSAPTGSALNTRPVRAAAKCGSGTWTVHRGTWTISSGLLQASTSDATATINAGQTNISAQATITNANGGSRIAGVAIDHTGATRIYLVGALSGPGTAQLRLVNGGTVTVLASASATITATTTVRITRNGATVTVSVNGVQALSFTLTSAQQTTLAGGTRVGLYWNSGNSIRFTNILATTPYSP
ncbi:MAG: hypothetical protein HY826_06360 [Actinobacteria bacterium]|nr:hypothetical protein [Actinomycetota bacterium]